MSSEGKDWMSDQVYHSSVSLASGLIPGPDLDDPIKYPNTILREARKKLQARIDVIDRLLSDLHRS